MNYKFGTKANWRRWQWNRIVERLAVPVRDAVVVYLAGPEDLDRPVALSKGFRPDNLIAVDRDGDVVKQLRMNGTLAINATLMESVVWFPPTKQIDAVVADYMGGFSASAGVDFLRMAKTPQARRAVFAVNLMHGRESSFRETRKLLSNMICDAGGDEDDKLHRGLYCVLFLMREWFSDLTYCDGAVEILKADLRIGGPLIKSIQSRMSDHMNPDYETYKSSQGMYYDSAVFNNPWGFGYGKDPQCEKFWDSKIAELAGKSCPVRRSISAVLAHRTMRQN
jgi:hypothetical protein